MDKLIFYKLVEEARQQARFGLMAFQSMRESLQRMENDQSFYHVHAMLGHVGAVSRLFWPDRAESAGRGTQLREALEVGEKSPLNLGPARARLERSDEALEDWIAGLEDKHYMDMNVMPVGTMAGSRKDTFQRNLDPDTYRAQFRGIAFDLRSLHDELRRVEGRCQVWLRTHSPW